MIGKMQQYIHEVDAYIASNQEAQNGQEVGGAYL